MARSLARALRHVLRRFGLDLVRYRRHEDPAAARPSHRSLGTHLISVFQHTKVECVLDVGAHEGQYGRLLRGCGYDGQIVSFEPVTANARTLREHARLD